MIVIDKPQTCSPCDPTVIQHPSGLCQLSRTECHGTWSAAARDRMPWVARVVGSDRAFCRRRQCSFGRVWFEVTAEGLYEFHNFAGGDHTWNGFFHVHSDGSINLLTPAVARRRASRAQLQRDLVAA